MSVRSDVTILGVHLYSDAYPNTKYVIDRITDSELTSAREICKPMFPDRPAFGKASSPVQRILRPILRLIRALYSHINVFTRYWLGPSGDVVYVPYPAVGVLTVFSLLPRAWRPRRIVADAFISIYDTAVTDRQLIRESSLLARVLRATERRAYNTATITTVDTDENRDYYAELFDLPSAKFVSMPLATDEVNYADTPYSVKPDRCHVLFVGTFVPLQGTDVIAKAIVELRDQENIRFTVLGSGQTANAFAGIVGDEANGNLTWISEWQDSASVARYIQSADICLGVFSDGPKTERVWPFKNYAYMACGRAVVTGDTACARRMLSAGETPAFVTVPTGDARALAIKLQELAGAPLLREQLARSARRYYEENLSDEVTGKKLIRDIIVA